MLKMKTLIRLTPNKVRLRSRPLRMYWRKKGVDRYDKRRNSDYRLYKMHSKPPRSNKTQQIFTQWVRVYPQTGSGRRSVTSQRVWVRCSCEFFMYNCEFALTQRGCASIRYSNGRPARITNPGNVPYLCKHLYKMMANVIRQEQRLEVEADGVEPEEAPTQVRVPRFMKDMREVLLRERDGTNTRREDGRDQAGGPNRDPGSSATLPKSNARIRRVFERHVKKRF